MSGRVLEERPEAPQQYPGWGPLSRHGISSGGLLVTCLSSTFKVRVRLGWCVCGHSVRLKFMCVSGHGSVSAAKGLEGG